MSRMRSYGVPLAVILVSVGVMWWFWPRTQVQAARAPLPILLGTSRADLESIESQARSRLTTDPGDGPAAVRLAEVLLRKARVYTDPAAAIEAERVLETLLEREPGQYSALKLLGAVYLSQHRFAEAGDVARRGIAINARDAWHYGVLGDASVELGRYEEAFAAFDTMVRLRPDAGAYSRVAYALELQGRLPDALRHMQMAAEATSAHDPEALAWAHAQAGNLLFQMGDLDGAARQFARASYVFPDHPYARAGAARVAAARGNYAEALTRYRTLMEEAPTPELAAIVGDLLARMGDAPAADEMYEQAERLERDGWKTEEPQPAALARLLADRGRKIDEAVHLAEEAAARRSDIFTMDALAWSYFQAGRLREARAASVQAMRTGTADRRIGCHAAAIERALREGSPAFDHDVCAFEAWERE